MEDWDPTEFQAVLRDFLDRRGWSQNDLAKATGISQAAINRWTQPLDSNSPAALTQPTDKTLKKLAPIIGIRLTATFGPSGATTLGCSTATGSRRA